MNQITIGSCDLNKLEGKKSNVENAVSCDIHKFNTTKRDREKDVVPKVIDLNHFWFMDS